jgi:aminopeptidase
MYLPNVSDFAPFSLERLLRTCFDLPSKCISCCVLIDLEEPKLVKDLSFMSFDGLDVQKRAIAHFHEPLNGEVGKKLNISKCDLFSFKTTGGSNLDPENELFDVSGNKLTFTDDICPNYDLILAITDYSLTAPLTAMAKKFNFRGATLHGVNDIILNSGLSVDYLKISKQAELFRGILDNADYFDLSFDCLGESYDLRIECNQQTAQKSHGLCPSGTPDVANLPAGEVYFVPSGANGSFPFRFSDGTLSQMIVENGAITSAILIRGDSALVDRRNKQLKEDPATGIIGELGFGTQILPFSGCDIQDEKILGTCHIATGRSDHLGGNLTPDLFNSRQNASHDDILYAPPKTPEITVSSVVINKSGRDHTILENYLPSSYLLDLLSAEYPIDLIRSALPSNS